MKAKKLKTRATPRKYGGHPEHPVRLRNIAPAPGESRGPGTCRMLADYRPTTRETFEANPTCPQGAFH